MLIGLRLVDLRNITLQRSSGYCLFIGSDRDHSAVWCRRSIAGIVSSCFHIFCVRRPAVNYSRRYWYSSWTSLVDVFIMQNLTGPITVFNKTIFDIMERQPNPPAYLHFIGWVYLWSAIFHWITALLNCMPHLSSGN